MIIRLAQQSDLSDIRRLFQHYDKMGLSSEYINDYDIAVVAESSKKVIGFLWIGLMASGTVGYIDKFTVDPVYKGKQVGHRLAMRAYRELKERRVREVIGCIQNDEFLLPSGANALKTFMHVHKAPFTYVSADMKDVIKNMEKP